MGVAFNRRLLAGLASVWLGLGLAGPGLAQGMAMGPMQAGFVTLTRTETPVQATLTGQAEAVEDASVRPLIDGLITEILYTPGREVDKDAPLFSIDPQTYEAAVASAEASLRSAEAAVGPARSTVERYERLAGTSISTETLEGARMTLAQAEAAVSVAEAALRTAQISLERTTIRSPVAGVPDIAGVSVGDLVTAGQSTALTTVTSLDPIHVDLSEASARMLELRARIESGAIKTGDRLAVSLTLENGQIFSGTGTLSSIGQRVSTSTGTVRVRFRFDNPDRLLLPGMFMRATVTMGTSDAFLIPQLAATPQADGTIAVWTLSDENRAQQRRLTPTGTTDRAWVVSEGLEDGTRLLVDGIANMAAGTEVVPVAVSISDDGLISNAAAGGN